MFIQESAKLVKSIVNLIYRNPYYTVAFTLFSLIYSLLSKKIYAPTSAYIQVLNKDVVNKNKDLQISHNICNKLMNISMIMGSISYFIRVGVILISVQILILDIKMQSVLVSINLLLSIIQSTIVSTVYFIEYSAIKKGILKDRSTISLPVKISVFISNVIGLFFQLIFLARILSYESNTIFHTIIGTIYCGCIFYILINQFYICPILLLINIITSLFLCFILFLDYFVLYNPASYTTMEQLIIMITYVSVSFIFPCLIFAIVRTMKMSKSHTDSHKC